MATPTSFSRARKDGGVAWEVSTQGFIAAAETLDGLLVLPCLLQELHPFLLVVAQFGFQKLNLAREKGGISKGWLIHSQGKEGT